MISKVIISTALLAVAAAQLNSGNNHGHGHGHAVSSQNIVLHQTQGHLQQFPSVAHHAPVVAHGPVIAHAPVIQHQPTHYASHGGHNVDYHTPAHYAYDYNVADTHTGDIKSQHETREGDAVQGFYSLHEADGTVRRVEYTVDGHSGFNAVVHREGHAAHGAPAHQPSHYSHH